jgi:hypothetical protein
LTIRREEEENLFLYLVQHVARAAQEGDIIAGDGDHFLIIYLSVYISMYLYIYTPPTFMYYCLPCLLYLASLLVAQWAPTMTVVHQQQTIRHCKGVDSAHHDNHHDTHCFSRPLNSPTSTNLPHWA